MEIWLQCTPLCTSGHSNCCPRSMMQVSTKTCKNSFSALKSFWLRALRRMLSKGSSHLASLWSSSSSQKINGHFDDESMPRNTAFSFIDAQSRNNSMVCFRVNVCVGERVVECRDVYVIYDIICKHKCRAAKLMWSDAWFGGINARLNKRGLKVVILRGLVPIWETLENSFGEGKWGELEEALISLVGGKSLEVPEAGSSKVFRS